MIKTWLRDVSGVLQVFQRWALSLCVFVFFYCVVFFKSWCLRQRTLGPSIWWAVAGLHCATVGFWAGTVASQQLLSVPCSWTAKWLAPFLHLQSVAPRPSGFMFLWKRTSWLLFPRKFEEWKEVGIRQSQAVALTFQAQSGISSLSRPHFPRYLFSISHIWCNLVPIISYLKTPSPLQVRTNSVKVT